jgi:hypothetical protein
MIKLLTESFCLQSSFVNKKVVDSLSMWFDFFLSLLRFIYIQSSKWFLTLLRWCHLVFLCVCFRHVSYVFIICFMSHSFHVLVSWPGATQCVEGFLFLILPLHCYELTEPVMYSIYVCRVHVTGQAP